MNQKTPDERGCNLGHKYCWPCHIMGKFLETMKNHSEKISIQQQKLRAVRMAF